MTVLDRRLRASCLMSILLLIHRPDRRDEIEAAIAEAYRVPRPVIRRLLRQHLANLAHMQQQALQAARL